VVKSERVTETGVWKWGTRKTRLTGGFSRAPYSQVWREILEPSLPPEKSNLGLAEMQFPAVLRGFSLFLVDILLRSQFVHTLTISMRIWTNYETKVSKSEEVCTPRRLVAPPVIWDTWVRRYGEPNACWKKWWYKKTTKGIGRGRVTNVRWKWVPDSNTKTMRDKGSVNTRNRQQVSVCIVIATVYV